MDIHFVYGLTAGILATVGAYWGGKLSYDVYWHLIGRRRWQKKPKGRAGEMAWHTTVRVMTDEDA